MGQERKEHAHKRSNCISRVCFSSFFFCIGSVISYIDYMAGESVPSSAMRTDQLRESRVGIDGRDTAQRGVVASSLKPEQTCFATKPQSLISDQLRLPKQLTNQPDYCWCWFPVTEY